MKLSDRKKVISVYWLASSHRNPLEPAERRWAIYVGRRQISEQKATPGQAWASAWAEIVKARASAGDPE
jgi:hypothetical protein